jgi:hypothetical protein
MLNNATTSSVPTKLNISGWTCRSIYNLRKGNIVIGPARNVKTQNRQGETIQTRPEVVIARYADLAVIGRPSGESAGMTLRTQLSSAIRETGFCEETQWI